MLPREPNREKPEPNSTMTSCVRLLPGQDTSLALLGDFQAELEDLPFYLELSTMGWRKLLSYSCEGTPHPPTYISGSVTSSIDHILLSPCYDDTTQHLVVEEVPGFQHCMLTCAFQVEPQQAYPRIAYPPKLHFPTFTPKTESPHYPP